MQTAYYAQRRYTILNMLRHLAPLSRKVLAELTDFRPSTVSELCKDLIEEGLVVEAGHYSVGHGRRRVLLEINNEHLCALGIAFSSLQIIFIVTQFDGTILHQEDLSFSPSLSREELACQIIAKVKDLTARFSDRKIVGAGIGEPLYGPAYYSGDDTAYESFTGWIRSELKPRLEEEVSFSVSCFNAVTLPALVEQRFGEARGCENFFCVELSNGIGCSICCNGKVVAGASGKAGELGHTVIDAGDSCDRPCYCGKFGCVERTSAFPAIAAEITSALDQGVYSVLNSFYDRSQPLRAQDIRRALEEGDQLCRRIVKRAANRIGIAIANSASLLNPELVVLYGFMLELGSYFLQELTAAIRENVFILSKNFEIRASSKLETVLPLGAAAEMFAQFLHAEDFAWIYRIDPEITNDKNDPDEAESE